MVKDRGVLKMISFEKAIETAQKKLKELQPDADFIELEQALINENAKQYEVTFSYVVQHKDKLEVVKEASNSGLARLSNLLRQRKVYKTFLITMKEGDFRGFKIYQAS